MAEKDDDEAFKPRPSDTWSDCLTTEASIDLVVPDRTRNVSYFKQITGPGAPHNFVFTRPKLIIGRSRAADITVDSPELSRKHIVVERDGQEYSCSDLESRNGLFLNGVKIHSCVLRHGDTIQIGNVTFIFHEGN